MKPKNKKLPRRVREGQPQGVPVQATMPPGFGMEAVQTGGCATWTSNPVPSRAASASSAKPSTTRRANSPR